MQGRRAGPTAGACEGAFEGFARVFDCGAGCAAGGMFARAEIPPTGRPRPRWPRIMGWARRARARGPSGR